MTLAVCKKTDIIIVVYAQKPKENYERIDKKYKQ